MRYLLLFTFIISSFAHYGQEFDGVNKIGIKAGTNIFYIYIC